MSKKKPFESLHYLFPEPEKNMTVAGKRLKAGMEVDTHIGTVTLVGFRENSAIVETNEGKTVISYRKIMDKVPNKMKKRPAVRRPFNIESLRKHISLSGYSSKSFSKKLGKSAGYIDYVIQSGMLSDKHLQDFKRFMKIDERELFNTCVTVGDYPDKRYTLDAHKVRRLIGEVYGSERQMSFALGGSEDYVKNVLSCKKVKSVVVHEFAKKLGVQYTDLITK